LVICNFVLGNEKKSFHVHRQFKPPEAKSPMLEMGVRGYFWIDSLAGMFCLAENLVQSPYPWRWLFMFGLALAYLLWVLWRGLPANHRPGENDLLPTLGLGNFFSNSRGFILVLFCGFLFSPWPDSGWKVWLPGLLYTLAALPDFVDGAAARLTNHVTKLGETLDISIDSLGVLGVSMLSVQYGQAPWWYIFVGLARYIFLGGIWLRQKLNLPVYNLPYSVRRRSLARQMALASQVAGMSR
jgi:phosphatidylglycerophosphate synthase